MSAAVLSDLKTVSGVLGVFVYDQKAGILDADVPAVFKPAKLSEIGRSLAKTFGAGQLAFVDLQDVALHYEEILLYVRCLKKTTHLVVLCDPHLNVNLLTMSLNLSMEELKELAEAAPAAPAQAEPKAAPPSPAPVEPSPAAPAPPPAMPKAEETAKPQPPPIPVGSLVEVERELTEMEHALAKVVGPMAHIIFQDARDMWLAVNRPSASSLPALVTIISREIGDQGKAAKYEALVHHLMERR